jgi:hypothetical protein
VILTPRRLRPSLGPVVLSVAAGVAVLLFGLLVNSCRINKLIGGGRPPAEEGPEQQLAVTPPQVHDSALSGTPTPRRSSIEIENNGRWVATMDSPWIALSPKTGRGQSSVTLILDPEGLKPGSHTGAITVTEPEAADVPVVVPVTLVIQQPILAVSPRDIERTTRSSNAQLSDTIVVRNTGTGPLVWTASNKSSWLMLGTVAGVGDGKIPLKLSSAGLAIATYRDTIMVVAVGATGSPAKIPVLFRRRKD